MRELTYDKLLQDNCELDREVLELRGRVEELETQLASALSEIDRMTDQLTEVDP